MLNPRPARWPGRVLLAAVLLAAVLPAPAAITLRGAEQNGIASIPPATISHVGAGAPASLEGCGSINPSIPAGSAGDLLIAQAVTKETDGGNAVAMSGWNTYYSAADASGGDNNELQVYIFWRIATGGDPNTLTQSGSFCNGFGAQISRFSGVDTASPFETASPGVVFQDSGDLDTGTITTASATAMLLVGGFISDDRNVSEGAGWSESYDFAYNGGGAEPDFGLTLNYQAQTAAGSKGVNNWDLSGGGSDENFGVVYALTPDTTSGGLTINVPAGTTTDDVMLAAVAVRPASVTITPPAGWTTLNRVDQTAGNSNAQAIFYRIATAAEPLAYTWTFSSAIGGAAGGIVSYSGVDTGTPVDAFGGNTTPNGTTHTANGITTTVADTRLISVHSFSSAQFWTPPGGMTERVDVASVARPDAAGIALEMNDEDRPAAGATGDRSATAAGSADTGAAHQVALRPVPGLADPQAEYRMDEPAWDGSAGEVTDQTGNGNDGTAQNGADTDDTNPALGGSPGTCGYGTFDGADDYVQVNGLSGILNDTASLAFWINTTQAGNDTGWQAPGVTGVEEAGGADDIFWGWLDASGNIGISVGNDYTTKSSVAVNDGSWHHVVLTRDASAGSYKIYIDGSLNASGSITAGVIGNGYSSLGRIEDTGGSPVYFNGQLDEVRVYDVVLGDAAVTTVMNATHPCPAVGARMEVASVILNDTISTPAFTAVTFNQTYDTPPLVFVLPSNEGSQPSAIRIRNVTTTGFEMAQVEPETLDGPHLAMTVDYIAIEEGTLTLPDGRVLEAGRVATSELQHGSGVPGGEGWETVTFATAFAGTPAVLAQIQTMNNESNNPPATTSIPWLVTAMQNVSASDMQLALERGEVDDAGPSLATTETIGYLAMEGGVQGSFVSGTAGILYESIVSADNITGWDNSNCAADNGVTVNFVNSYAAPPLVVASQNRHDGGDGGWLRRCGPVAADHVRLAVDEDQFNDSERSHTAEAAGLLVFSEEFCVPACAAAVIDHYDISHDGSGVSCLSDVITVTAIDTDGNTVDPGNVTINLSVAPVSGDAVLPPAKGDWVRVASGSGTLTNTAPDGSADYTFPGDGSSSVSLVFNYTRFETGNSTETINFNVDDGPNGVTDTRDGDPATDPDLTYALTGFQFYNETDGNAVVPTQIAGKPSGTAPDAAALALRAVRVSDQDPSVCEPAFPDGASVAVPLGAECRTPATCAGRQVAVTNNGVTTQVATSDDNGAFGASAYTPVNLLFQDDGGGIVRAPLDLSYADAGEIQLHARYEIPLDEGGTPPAGAGSGGFMTGATNPYVVRPFGLAVGPVQDGGGAPNPGADTPAGNLFVTAGSDFQATVTAALWQAADDDGSACDPVAEPACAAGDGIPDTNADLSDNNGGAFVTPNFQGAGAADTTLNPVAPYRPDAAVGGVLGPLLDSGTGAPPVIAAADYAAGSAALASLIYNQVGSMTLQAEVADYLGTGQGIRGRSSNLGGNPNNGAVGRFGADHFTFVANTPVLGPACGNFTYVDQPFDYTTAPQITARATAADGSTVLTNYQDFSAAGGANWWLLDRGPVAGGGGVDMSYTDLAAPTDIQLDSALSSYAPNSGTTGTNGQQLFALSGPLAYAKDAPPVAVQAPFNGSVRLDFSVTDSDGAGGSYSINPVTFNSPQQRWGRLAVINASGSELIDLNVPLRAEYWDGTSFIRNNDDSCTVIEDLDGDIILSNPDTAGGAPQPGDSSMIVNDGTTQITSGAPAISSGEALLTFSAPDDGDDIPDTGFVDIEIDLSVDGGSGGSDDPWLKFDWDGDGDFSENPTGRASFGIYRGSDELIYTREPWD